ncbi:MAG: acetylxylan esterase [Planctomycetes bacterium]|nr:acetylxylan esterase [Planctomycetota bacterium]
MLVEHSHGLPEDGKTVAPQLKKPMDLQHRLRLVASIERISNTFEYELLFLNVLEGSTVTSTLTRRPFVILALVLAPFSAALAQENVPAVTLKVFVDRADAIYHAGEAATFSIEALRGDQALPEGNVVCVFSRDGWKPQSPQTVALKDGKGTLTGKLDEPGFLMLKATLGKTSALAAAAYDPLQLKPSLSVPEDFDEFWSAQKAALAKVLVKSTLTSVTPPAKGIEAFDVQVDCLGKPVSGYYGRPLDAKPKSLPAILFVHGAGVRSANLASTHWAANEGGMLALDINAHGIPNGKPAEFYTDLAAGDLKDYRSVGRQNREECYFTGMFLRLIRAIDFLAEQPEWDGKTMIVYGSSQGGFQALAAAGLDSRVTFICAGVPAGCDHTGIAVNRINGWPKIVPNDDQGKPDAAVLQASRYIDCVNFATRARCKGAAVTVGFIDTTCPPTGVYVAYNALPVPKEIHADVLAGHTNTPGASKFMQEAAFKHVRAMK